MAPSWLLWVVLSLLASPTHPLPSFSPTPTPSTGTDDGVPSPKPSGISAKPTFVQTSPPTTFQYYNKLQDISGKLLGTTMVLSSCMPECSTAGCPQTLITNAGCYHGKYLVLGDSLHHNVQIWQRFTPDQETSETSTSSSSSSSFASASVLGQYRVYSPVMQPGTTMPQTFNWTTSISQNNYGLVRNRTSNGGIAIFLERGGTDYQADILAIGRPLETGSSQTRHKRGAVNIYQYMKYSDSAAARGFVWTQKLLPPTSVVGDVYMGSAVAMGNKVLAAGTNNQYVFVYRYQPKAPLTFAFEASLCACGNHACNSGQGGNRSSNTIAMPQNGNSVVIACSGSASATNTAGTPNGGSVMVYTYAGKGASSPWTLQQNLQVGAQCTSLSSLKGYETCNFGHAIAMTAQGDVFVVSASCPANSPYGGIIYTFYNSSSSSSSSSRGFQCSSNILSIPSNPSAPGGVTHFGFSLAIFRRESGYYLLAGNPVEGEDSGDVRVLWAKTAAPPLVLLPWDGSNDPQGGGGFDEIYTRETNWDYFGYSVAAVDGSMVISSPWAVEQNSDAFRNIEIFSDFAPTGVPTGSPTSRPSHIIWPTYSPTSFSILTAYVPAVVYDNGYVATYSFALPAASVVPVGHAWYLSVAVFNAGYTPGMSVTNYVGGGGGANADLRLVGSNCRPVSNQGGTGAQSAAGASSNCSSLTPPAYRLRSFEPAPRYSPPSSAFSPCTTDLDVTSAVSGVSRSQTGSVRVMTKSVGMTVSPRELPRCTFNHSHPVYMRYILSPYPLGSPPEPEPLNYDEETVNNPLLTSGTSMFLSVVVALVAASTAVMLVKAREAEETVVPLKLYSTVFTTALACNSLVAELFLVYIMDSKKKYTDLALVVLLGRIIHVGVASWFMTRILGPERFFDIAAMGAKMNAANFKHHVHLYGLVLLAGLLDTPLLRLLPWKLTDFSARHDGWPDEALMRWALGIKLFQSVLTLLADFIFLGLVMRSRPNLNNVSVLFLSYLTISFAIMIVLVLQELFMRLCRPSAPLDDKTIQMLLLLASDEHGGGSGVTTDSNMKKWAEGRISLGEDDRGGGRAIMAASVINPMSSVKMLPAPVLGPAAAAPAVAAVAAPMPAGSFSTSVSSPSVVIGSGEDSEAQAQAQERERERRKSVSSALAESGSGSMAALLTTPNRRISLSATPALTPEAFSSSGAGTEAEAAQERQEREEREERERESAAAAAAAQAQAQALADALSQAEADQAQAQVQAQAQAQAEAQAEAEREAAAAQAATEAAASPAVSASPSPAPPRPCPTPMGSQGPPRLLAAFLGADGRPRPRPMGAPSGPPGSPAPRPAPVGLDGMPLAPRPRPMMPAGNSPGGGASYGLSSGGSASPGPRPAPRGLPPGARPAPRPAQGI